ncbi:MAG: protoporphyrinogen oxidase [Chlamydiia bacterium]|nr:protoporphyrinogen oxidase [Chlamydiia bacterium]
MKKITIIGGGISGLVARYDLSKRFPNTDIQLYEKTERLGGVIDTLQAPFFFERGPRTLQAGRSPELLQLIEELGLQKELIPSSPKAKKRYIYHEKKLCSLGKMMWTFLPAFLKEWRQPYPWEGDESIASFATRRLGKEVAETLFDPMALGIYGGDIHHLSISACFPALKAMEKEHGSLTKAVFKRKKKKHAKGLLTLKGGLQTLITRLTEEGKGEIHLGKAVDTFPEGQTILAVPVRQAARFFQGDLEAMQFFEALPSASLTVVHLAFEKGVQVPHGFGYLVPTKEEEDVLGVVFDSEIFPQQSRHKEMRLTVMLRQGGEEEALSVVRRHLGIDQPPAMVHSTVYLDAIPQYGVDHLKRVAAFEAYLEKHYPQVTCIGNYLKGVSLNACVKLSRGLKYKKSNAESSCTPPSEKRGVHREQPPCQPGSYRT